MKIIQVETPEQVGIEYRGEAYVVNPTLGDLEKAQGLLREAADQGAVMEALGLLIPELPVREIAAADVAAVASAAMAAVLCQVKPEKKTA